MLRMKKNFFMFQLIFIGLLIENFISVYGSVYPNFRSEWEFKSFDNKKDWYESASFYQIYPRSFKDGDGDGIGDIKGIIEKLPYLKEIGVTAAWLSPIFKSPMKDFGYDISDFYDIQPEYGNLDEFKQMMKLAKELDIKILLDFVPNHSSDENEWFKKSVKREKGYENFYVWHPGYPDPKNSSNRLPPSNWRSVFRGSAWQWNDERKEFYLHQFLAAQPDLNYRDPNVVAEMKNVLKYWLDFGVDGFRIDAVPHLFEIKKDENNKYKDEPRNPSITDPDDWNYVQHIYTVDQDETIDMLYEWRELLDNYQIEHNTEAKVLLAESYSPINIVMKYYGDGERKGVRFPFNFLIIEQLNNASNANDYSKTLNLWLDNMPKGYTANWVSGNHDKPRVATRMNTDRIDLMNFIIMTLPGASVHYNGDEIGMTDVWISWNDTVDPAACNSNPDIYENFSRDPQRTPFQWSDEKNAGFSTAEKTWLPISDNYKRVNVKVESTNPLSPFSIFNNLQRFRSSNKVIQDGSTKIKAINDQVLVIIRKLEKNPTYITLSNIGNKLQTVDLTGIDILPDNLVYEVISSHSTHKIGDVVLTKSINLKPYEAVVLKTNQKFRQILGFYYYTNYFENNDD